MLRAKCVRSAAAAAAAAAARRAIERSDNFNDARENRLTDQEEGGTEEGLGMVAERACSCSCFMAGWRQQTRYRPFSVITFVSKVILTLRSAF